MAKPQPHVFEFGPMIEWQIEFLSARCAEYGGLPQVRPLETMKEGLRSFSLPTITWVVEQTDGTRSHQQIIERLDFFVWWKTDGLFEVSWQQEENLWPPEIFQDTVPKQRDQLLRRWRVHTGSAVVGDFYDALTTAEDELGVLCWQNKNRFIRREDFVTWYKASPFVTTLSATAEISRAVNADDLWPQSGGSKDDSASTAPPNESGLSVAPWKDLSPHEVIKRACGELFPDGVPRGMMVKARNAELSDYIVNRGGRRPSERTYRRALKSQG